MAGAKNITVIPAKKRVGNTATAESKPKLKAAAYCRVVLTAKNRLQATMHRLRITQNLLERILNGSLPGFMLMTVSAEQTLKSEKSLTT